MAKTTNNFAAPPSPSEIDPDYVEMDRFPPRRGNQKEVRRTVAIIGGSLAILLTGLVLRPILAPDVPLTPSQSQETLLQPGLNRRPRGISGTAPIATRITSKADAIAPGYSPFDGASPSPSADSTSTTDVAINKPYDPFAPSGTPSSPVPLTSPGMPALSATSKPTVYGESQEPPITPSLSRTGGVYKPGDFATPPPVVSGAIPFGGGTTSGTATGTNPPSYVPAPIGGGGSLPAPPGPYVAPRLP